MVALPLTTEELTARIRGVAPLLSPQCQKVASYLVDYPFMIALLTLDEFACGCRVPPASVVYFAKRLGFLGFSQLKLSFRTALLQQLAPGLAQGVSVRPVKRTPSARPVVRKKRDVQISYHH